MISIPQAIGRVAIAQAIAFTMACSVATAAESQSQASPTVAPQLTRDVAQSWSCQPRKTCKRIGTCEEAEYYLANCSWGGKLDADNDGVPCELICGSN